MKSLLLRFRYAGLFAGMLLVTSNINWGGDHWRNLLQHDARGYYDYLPAAFIYHDLQFGFIDSLNRSGIYDPSKFHDYRLTIDSQVVNKYYAGTAVAELPFFLAAHALTIASGGSADGYSRLYPIFINLGALCYALAGLWFTGQTLRWTDLPASGRSFVMLALFFGTHLFYYTISEPGMSHVYSFAFVAAFLSMGGRYFREGRDKALPVLAFCLAMIVLIRPVNGLVVAALPLLAGNWQTLVKRLSHLRRRPLLLGSSILLFLLIVSLQPILYYLQTGHWWVYSYGQEGFNFARPEILNYLFSYRKGLFVYTPLTFLALWGGYFLLRQRPWEGLGTFLPLVLGVYVFSSWWSWWYGGSFSQRAMVEFLPLFGYLLAWLFLPQRTVAVRRTATALTIALVLFCQVQIYQYRYQRIHYSEMNAERYWSEFLRIDRLIK